MTEIESYVFSGCINLESIVIPESVTKLGYMAFYGCDKLVEINIPEKVSQIGAGIFAGCDNLVKITVSKNNGYYEVVDGILYEKAKNRIICYPAGKTDRNYLIPNTVTSIAEYAFYGCKNLEAVFITERITRLEGSVFSRCENLKYVFIPKSVTHINSYAFEDDKKLVNVYYDGADYEWRAIARSGWISVRGYDPLEIAEIYTNSYSRQKYIELISSLK